jgi:hypothetical protein
MDFNCIHLLERHRAMSRKSFKLTKWKFQHKILPPPPSKIILTAPLFPVAQRVNSKSYLNNFRACTSYLMHWYTTLRCLAKQNYMIKYFSNC